MRKETQFVVFLYSAAKSLIKKDQISVFLRRKNDQKSKNSLLVDISWLVDYLGHTFSKKR